MDKRLAKKYYLLANDLEDQLQKDATIHPHESALYEDSNFEDSGTKGYWILKRLAQICRAEKDYKNASKYYAKMCEELEGGEQPTQFGSFPFIADYIDFLIANHEERKAKLLLDKMIAFLKKDPDPKNQGCDSLVIATLEFNLHDNKHARFYLEKCKHWRATHKDDIDAIHQTEKVAILEKSLNSASAR